jgi:hypothetical protein
MHPWLRGFFIVAGVLLLVGAIIGTVGLGLVALVGVATGWAIQRTRGRSLTPAQSWFAAVGATTVVIGIFIVGLLFYPDPKTHQPAWRSMQGHADSLAAHPAPPPSPPAFLRYLPGGDIPQPAFTPSGAMATPLMVWAMLIGAEMMGAFVGSAVWAGVWVVRYGINGGTLVSPESVQPVE